MTTVEAHGIAAVTAFLDSHGVRHEVVEHRPTFSAAAEARAAGADAFLRKPDDVPVLVDVVGRLLSEVAVGKG